MNYLLFRTAGTLFACDFDDIIRIVPTAGISVAPAPSFPKYMTGTAAIDGEVIPIIDSALRFGMDTDSKRAYSCYILSNTDRDSQTVGDKVYKKCALLVDEVCGSANTDALLPSPAVNADSYARYVTGSFLYEGEVCYVITPRSVIG